ncbi:unnamed protein product [Amaranthus hypochondriacus]
MASGILGADELPKEKYKWSENSKVYTRKNFRNKNNVKNPDSSTTTTVTTTTNSPAAVVASKAPENENNNEKSISLKENNVPNNHVVVNGVTTPASNKSNSYNSVDNHENDKNTNDVQQNLPSSSSSPKGGVEQANSSQPQQNLSHVETVSGDSFSLNRAEAPQPDGHDGNLGNGSVFRSLALQVGDRLNICVSAARSIEEIRDLKRKLEDELDEVRKMAKRLEDKEVEINQYSSDIGVESNVPVGGTEMRGSGLRMDSDAGSVPYNEPRPFRQLTVSVMDNNHHHGFVGEIVEKEKRTPKANSLYRNSEFLLGKDKLPPESNRKTKSSGGKRHSGSEFDYGFRIDKKSFSKCSSLLQKIMKHKHGWVFNQPVDVKGLGLHDYFDIIKHPMDLGTVKTRLAKNWYKTPREFAEDVRLTFHNAMTYNPPGQDVHIMATELLDMFEERWPAIESEYDQKLRRQMVGDLGVPTPTSRMTYSHPRGSIPMSFAPPPHLQTPRTFHDMRLERSQSMPVRPQSTPKPTYSVGRKPALQKPKAKDLNKRDMTFEEKQKLGINLQNLPSEKLDSIVQIIRRRNSALSQRDDEIEVDIDSVDTETLWELDRFVTNYKKSLSKYKRRAELAQARAEAARAAQESIPAPANIQMPRETTADEGNVAGSPRAQPERHSDNASGSSSSSGSSSDSGSSTSDSDSDSSSASDSDGGH